MPTTDRRSAIILNIDGLRTGMLGPYGNTWFDTPSFNRFAADSIVYQQCIAQTPNPDLAYQSMLTGQHPAALMQGDQGDSANVLPDLQDDTIFLTDRPALPAAGIEDLFDRVIQVGQPHPATELVDSVEQATIARFFAESIDWIQNHPDASLFWLDCQGLFGSWDAPYRFRALSVDPDDPDAPTLCDPPSAQFNAKSDDPDQLLGCQQAYAGQVMLLDQCLGVLLEELENFNRLHRTLVCIYSSSGYPLGEHGVVGCYRPILNSESIHVPLMIRWPGSSLAAIRDHNLVHPGILPSVLRAWFEAEAPDLNTRELFQLHQCFSDLVPNKKTQAIFSICDSSSHRLEALQTHAWKLIRGNGTRLYVRPDDIWEVNDIHSRCMDVTRSLEALMDSGIQRLNSGKPFLGEPLADELAFGVE